MTYPRWLWPTIIFVSVCAISVATSPSTNSPVRTAITLWFLLVCPGIAYVSLLYAGDFLGMLAIGIAFSLSIDTVVAGVFLYAGDWAPRQILTTLIGFSLVGAAIQLGDFCAIPLMKQKVGSATFAGAQPSFGLWLTRRSNQAALALIGLAVALPVFQHAHAILSGPVGLMIVVLSIAVLTVREFVRAAALPLSASKSRTLDVATAFLIVALIGAIAVHFADILPRG